MSVVPFALRQHVTCNYCELHEILETHKHVAVLKHDNGRALVFQRESPTDNLEIDGALLNETHPKWLATFEALPVFCSCGRRHGPPLNWPEPV
jgi:hypothetical protein